MLKKGIFFLKERLEKKKRGPTRAGPHIFLENAARADNMSNL